MKRKVHDWSIAEIEKKRDRISFPEYQRQERLWSLDKKRLLIDSILKDIDIPKLYFNQTKGSNYEVVDGQQRLWAIWDFLDDLYTYKDEDRHASDQSESKFSELDSKQQKHIEEYELQITVFEDAGDKYLRQLFIRLQLGLLLITGEKLHAARGAMKEFIFDRVVRHEFMRNLGIPKRRYAKETLCAQIAINSFTRKKLEEFARTRYEDLEYFFDEYANPRGKDLEFFRGRTKKIEETVDELNNCFGERAKELRNRSYIVTVYLFFEELCEKGISAREQKAFPEFVLKLWARLKEEVGAGFDRRNRDLYSFETFLSSAPGEKYQIARRHDQFGQFYEHFKKTGKIKGDK